MCTHTHTHTHTLCCTRSAPKNRLVALQTSRTRRLSTFYYCQIVNRALLRLLSTYILVSYRVMANYNIKLSNVLYHWQLSMGSFRFCETCLLHIKPLAVNKSAVSPFLGGYIHTDTYMSLIRAHTHTHTHTHCVALDMYIHICSLYMYRDTLLHAFDVCNYITNY